MITLAVYSNGVWPRLQYVVSFIAGYFNIQAKIFTDLNEFKNYNGVKICYANERFANDSVWIQPAHLLFEKNIQQQKINVGEKDGHTTLFATNAGYSFDVLTAIFYLLSRYEEYLPHSKDEYGRYAYQNSIACKEKFLQQPLINIWLYHLRIALIKTSGIALPDIPFSFTPTYDIDMAWSYRAKGLWRNSGGIAKDVVKKNWTAIKNRIAVLQNKTNDPYDVYDWLDGLHQTYHLNPIYFFHVGSQRNQYDKSIPISNVSFQQTIKNTAKNYAVGVHPSWHSNAAIVIVKKEKESLEALLQQPVVHSRQHYIYFHLPQTFRNLLHLGIQHDYSMGYGSINGFRASVAAPYFWYDLERETQTELLLHPFSFMDANAFFEEQLSAADALGQVLQQYEQLKKWGGNFCTIWHNNILGSDEIFAGWRQMYAQVIAKVSLP